MAIFMRLCSVAVKRDEPRLDPLIISKLTVKFPNYDVVIEHVDGRDPRITSLLSHSVEGDMEMTVVVERTREVAQIVGDLQHGPTPELDVPKSKMVMIPQDLIDLDIRLTEKIDVEQLPEEVQALFIREDIVYHYQICIHSGRRWLAQLDRDDIVTLSNYLLDRDLAFGMSTDIDQLLQLPSTHLGRLFGEATAVEEDAADATISSDIESKADERIAPLSMRIDETKLDKNIAALFGNLGYTYVWQACAASRTDLVKAVETLHAERGEVDALERVLAMADLQFDIPAIVKVLGDLLSKTVFDPERNLAAMKTRLNEIELELDKELAAKAAQNWFVFFWYLCRYTHAELSERFQKDEMDQIEGVVKSLGLAFAIPE